MKPKETTDKFLQKLKPKVQLPTLSSNVAPKERPAEKKKKQKNEPVNIPKVLRNLDKTRRLAKVAPGVAQRMNIPLFFPRGEIEAEITAHDLTTTSHPIACVVKSYSGNLVIELKSNHSQMVFTTNNTDDMRRLEQGLRVARKKAQS
jgi:hypothetical protein